MNDPQRKRRSLATWVTVILGSALLLGGCGERSVSGAYVSRDGNEGSLLQITETPDHRFTGTLRHVALNNDGTLSSISKNVSGSVDGDSITLAILETPLPIGENFSGTVSRNGIDLTVSVGARTGVEHFVRGEPSDYDTVVAQFSRAGQPIIAARERGRRVDQLDRQADALTDSLNRFVTQARYSIERLPHARTFYDHAVALEQAKLERARQLAASGNAVADGQAGVIVGQIGVDKSQISISDDSLERTITNEASAEKALNARIEQWKGNCLGPATGNVSDVIPDMGPCKGLSRAVDAYNTVLPPLHTAIAEATEAKARGHTELATIWQAAENVH